MRQFLIYFITMGIVLGYCQRTKAQVPAFIEFTRNSSTGSRTEPLYISTDSLRLQLDSDEYENLKSIFKIANRLPTKEEEDKYVNEDNLQIITDTITYSKLVNYILKNTQLYIKRPLEGYEGYTILAINIGKQPAFFLLKKDIGAYFDSFIGYLKSENCDKNVINAIIINMAYQR
jgi:hypothetical protein